MSKKPEIEHVCEVVVIGGGPAGATTAARLAMRGRKVVLLEKEHHPRFHIGESLLPMSLPLLEELGVLDEIHTRVGVVKPGAEFNSEWHQNRRQVYFFREAWDKRYPHAYEVTRSEFDAVLFRNAIHKGAEAYEGMRVTGVEFHAAGGGRVQAVDETGQEHMWEAQFIVDASGRDTLLSRRFGLRERNPAHNSAALFGHFRNVVRRQGEEAGNISVYWFEHGWFWMIPLQDDIMSVGAVCWPEYLRSRDCSPAEFLMRSIAHSPSMQARMDGAELISEVQATGNFTYLSKKAYGQSYLLVGDAFAFLDPVFSSGVHLALYGAFEAAATVDAILDSPHKAKRLCARYERFVRRGMKQFSWFIYRFNTRAMQNLFLSPNNTFRMLEGVTTLLAGDVFRKTPMERPIAIFKMVYYVTALAHLPKSWAIWRRQRRNRAVIFEGGTLPVDRE